MQQGDSIECTCEGKRTLYRSDVRQPLHPSLCRFCPVLSLGTTPTSDFTLLDYQLCDGGILQPCVDIVC